MKSAYIFCSKGLGDGLIFLVIAQNLHTLGYKVHVCHDFLDEMQEWFEQFQFCRYENFSSLLQLPVSDYYIINGDDRPINRKITSCAQCFYPEKTFVLFPTTCKGKNLSGDFLFNTKMTMVENLQVFCKQKLGVENPLPTIPFLPPKNLAYRKYSKRVILHSTAKNPNRIWPIKKMKKLACKIQKMGYEPVFCLSSLEENDNKIQLEGYQVFVSKTLQDLACLLYESGYFVGNDSGVGHLASFLQIPTLTIFSSNRKRILWKPGFSAFVKTVAPYSFIPNWKMLRLREKLWKFFIESYRVFYHFKKLIEGRK